MKELEKRRMYLKDIFDKMVLEGDRRNSGDQIRDLYSVYMELGIMVCVIMDEIREKVGG